MKNFFKKLVSTICAVSVSALLLTTSVTALAQDTPRSLDEAGTAVTDTVKTSTGTESGRTGASANTGTAASANNVAQSAGKTSSGKGSGWSGFLWFLLSVAVNFVLSCWIGNRFYRMARKSAQGSAEIRALRKDIEEKFAGTITDISEPATEIINRNENYARTDDGITMPERKSHIELNEEELETMKRWDMKRSSSKPSREEERGEDDNEDEYDAEPRERKTAKRAYQPTRRSSGIEFEEDDEDEQPREARRPARMPQRKERSAASGAISNAKNKAKNLINNVFPFDE